MHRAFFRDFKSNLSRFRRFLKDIMSLESFIVSFGQSILLECLLTIGSWSHSTSTVRKHASTGTTMLISSLWRTQRKTAISTILFASYGEVGLRVYRNSTRRSSLRSLKWLLGAMERRWEQ